MTEERRGNIYIGSEKGQTKTHRAREVRDWASPDRSRETDETSGIISKSLCLLGELWELWRAVESCGELYSSSVLLMMGLMQEERRSKGIRSGMGVDVGNRLDARKRRG